MTIGKEIQKFTDDTQSQDVTNMLKAAIKVQVIFWPSVNFTARINRAVF